MVGTGYLAHGAFALGLFSLFLAMLAFITVVTEDEVGKSTPSEWVALVASAGPSALFGLLAPGVIAGPLRSVSARGKDRDLGFVAALAAPLPSGSCWRTPGLIWACR